MTEFEGKGKVSRVPATRGSQVHDPMLPVGFCVPLHPKRTSMTLSMEKKALEAWSLFCRRRKFATKNAPTNWTGAVIRL